MDRDARKRTDDQMSDLNQSQDDETLHVTTDEANAELGTAGVDVEANRDSTTRRVGTSGSTESVDLDDKELQFTLAEEQLRADVYETRIGTVAISKRTEELPAHGTIDVSHDEVQIEHKDVNEPVAKAEDPWYDGDTLVIPVYEEVLVTEKRLYLKEEIRVTLVKESEDIEINDTVRRQVVDVTSDTSRGVEDEITTADPDRPGS